MTSSDSIVFKGKKLIPSNVNRVIGTMSKRTYDATVVLSTGAMAEGFYNLTWEELGELRDKLNIDITF